MTLLTELHAEGHTILAAVHDLQSALSYFPRAVLLNEGRLTDDGPTENVVLSCALETAFSVRVHTGPGVSLSPVRLALTHGPSPTSTSPILHTASHPGNHEAPAVGRWQNSLHILNSLQNPELKIRRMAVNQVQRRVSGDFCGSSEAEA